MKIYSTVSNSAETPETFHEFTSSASDASKVCTRLKKLGHLDIKTDEVELGTTRTELIQFMNGLMAHPSWVVEPTAAALS